MKLKKKFIIYGFSFLTILILTFIVSNREVGLVGDTKTYTNKFIVGTACKCMGDSEIGFELFLLPMYLLSFSPEMIFFVISLLTYLLIFISSRKNINLLVSQTKKTITNKHKYYITTFSLLIMIPIIYQLHTNAIRQGLSSLILLMSYMYYQEAKLKKSIALLIISTLFHVSAILIVPFFILFFYTKLKLQSSFFISITIFIFLSLLYLLGYSEPLVKNISDVLNIQVWELVSTYGSESSVQRGIRYDFYFFTVLISLPILVYSLFNKAARSYFVFIVISTIPFLLLGWGAYSNRYLFNVWIYILLAIASILTLKFINLKGFYLFLFFFAFIFNIVYTKVYV